MVRETRHLWVGNLPENIREDRIREHFKRYGRVQSVKLLPRVKEDDGSTGLCATVAFMDIKSASKAHNMEHKLDERCLSTSYYEPPIPGGSSAPLYAAAPRFPHGVPDEHVSGFDRSALFYERSREGDAYLRRQASNYHVTADPLRGRTRERLYRNGPVPYTQIIDRPPLAHHRTLGGNAWTYEGTNSRYPSVPPTPEPYPDDRRDPLPAAHKKRPKSSRSGSESGSNSGSSRSRSRSRSRSSSSSSNSGSSSCSSGTSSPVTGSPHSSRTARSGKAVQSTVSAPHNNSSSPAVHSEDRRPLAICVRNLPIRSSDTSLKDGLFHEYKKHGKVTWVKVVGQGQDRYALVCFKKPEDVEKALEVSHDKLFFGCKIEVASYQGYDVDDNESRPYEAELDEFHPKATRTLFIGNLEKDVTATELRKHFEQFGEIIEIDIKKQGAVSSYAFCQYSDIASVVKAMRTMDGEHLGNNRIKLGFGKSMPTNCVWVDGVADNVSEKYLNLQFNQFGSISHVTIDRERGHALIYFEQIPSAQDAVRDMRGVMQRGRKLQVDFASRECQEAFYEHLEKQGHAVVGGERPWDRYDNTREVQAGRFETTVVVPGARFPRYETPSRARPSTYTRTPNSTGAATATVGGAATPGQSRGGGRGQRPGQRYSEYYDPEYPERRYSRGYDDVSQGSPASHEGSFEHDIRDYGYGPRTSPSPSGCEGEGRRSASGPPDKGLPDDDGYKRLQSVVVSDVAAPPPDMRHLQKERVHLLEQLEECASSGDDDIAPKKRTKVDCNDLGMMMPGNCFDLTNHDTPNLVVTTHNHRKSVSEVRRLSDASLKHCSRRPSNDSRHMDVPLAYAPHPVCKRRKTGSSASEGEDRLGCRKHVHHHHHHSGEPDNVDGSRPGTPLCDERPENLLPPSEPRRPRERLTEGPLSLPLPRFAAQILSQRALAGKPVVVSPPASTSPRVPALHPPPSPSPSPAPPPSSPPPRPPSLPDSSSSDSEFSPPSPTLEERIRSVNEMYEKWSGSRNVTAPSETIAKLDASSERFRLLHKPINFNELKPSDIVKSVLAKPSVFDEDSKRLENVGDKYEPKEFVPFKGTGCFQSLRIKTECGTPIKTPTTPQPVSFPSPALPSRLVGMSSPLHSPNQPPPKSPFSTGTPTTPTSVKSLPMSPGVTTAPQPCKLTTIPKTGALSPRAAGSGIPAAKGLQYPFPSHPPVLPTTTVATTTATNVMALVSVSVTIPSTGMAYSPEVSRTCVVKPVGVSGVPNDPRSRGASSVMILTTATATKPSPEVSCRVQVPQRPDTSATASVKIPVVSRPVCLKPPTTTTIPSTGTILSAEVFRTISGKGSGSVISPDETGTRLPSVTSFPTQGHSVVTSGLGSAKVTCAVTTTPVATTRTTPSCIRPTPSTTPTSSTSVPSTPRLAKITEHSPKISKESNPPPPRLETLQSESNIPTSPSDPSSTSAVAPLVSTATVVTSVTTVETTSTTVLTPSIMTTSVTSTTNTPTASVSTDNQRQSHKPKTVLTPKPQPPSNKNVTPKKEKEDSKFSSSHKAKSLDEKKEKKEAVGLVCTRRESEGKDKKRDKESGDMADSKKRDRDNEERRREWDPAEVGGRELEGEESKKDGLDGDRLSWKDKDSSDNRGSQDKDRSEGLEKKKDFPDERWRDNQPVENILKERWKDKEENIEKRKENHIDHLSKDSELDSKEKKVHESTDRRKDAEPTGSLDRRKDQDSAGEIPEKKCVETLDKRKDVPDNLQRRKSTDNVERRKNRESPENVDKRKDREHINNRKEPERKDRSPTEITDRKKERNPMEGERKKDREPVEVTEKWKPRETSEEKSKDMELEEKRKERRKERASSVNSPASIGGKRRMSSQDSIEVDEAKRPKLSERRDSKDSGRSSSGSSKRGPHHSFAKPHDEKTKHEVERKRHEHEKNKDRQKKKAKEPKSKEVTEDQETSPRLNKQDSDPDDKEEAKQKHTKKESTERKKTKSEEVAVESLDEKARSTKKDREKRGSSEKRKDEKEDNKNINKKDPKHHKHSLTDTESEDGDGPKKHSIFDIVDDGPAYISMYDKVKARSTKNMQKQEEEKRQEKMREKFSLLKASRAKREEKKRSTSWDEDSDSDAEHRRAKRAGKPVISSSSEDETNRGRSLDDSGKGKQAKKEDLGLGDSDSDSRNRRGKQVNSRSEDDENCLRIRPMSTARKTSRSKLISDTSEDEMLAPSFKLDPYSAESDADQGFADSDDRHPTVKKPSKNNKFNKSVMDVLSEETNRKHIPDILKGIKDRNSSFRKNAVKNKNKGSIEFSDDEKSKVMSDSGKSDFFDEIKLSAIFKKSNKNKSMKMLIDSSDDEHTRKLITDVVKAEIFGDEKSPMFNKKSNKNKLIKRCLDSSDDELARKILNSPKIDIKTAIKNKSIKSSPESFDEDNSRKFLSEAEKAVMFGEAIPTEKTNSHSKNSSVVGSFSDGDHTPVDKKSIFYGNSLEKSSESSRKKAHKKKQKRLKDPQLSPDGVSKDQPIENHIENKVKSEKKHKRERRKSVHGDDQSKVGRVRKKKANKQDISLLKPESSLKRDEKMEDIFGPLSDDSETSMSKVIPTLHNNGGRALETLASKWQVSLVYGSDSDSVDPSLTNIVTTPIRPIEKERKRREKKRRDRKVREEGSIGSDLVEAGRVLEAKLLDTEDFMTSDIIKRESSDADIFRFTDGDESLETATAVLLEKAKEKKKKRKKSKEEKQNKHHHHHHHDKSKSSPDRKLSITSEDASLPALTSPPLPSLEMIPTEVKPITPNNLSVIPSTNCSIPCKISPKSTEKKKTDKFIPGFGVALDDAIHETAVKSISEFEAPKLEPPPKVEESKKEETSLPKDGEEIEGEDEKPRAVISQEETEDAVAALLGESFGADDYDYDGSGSPHHAGGTSATQPQLQTDEEEETRQAVEGLIDMKPDTPQSEADLQIDTDTEGDDGYVGLRFSSDENNPRTPETIDFSKPPKTPDLPPSYYRNKALEVEAAMVKTPPNREPLASTPLAFPKPIPLKIDTPESSDAEVSPTHSRVPPDVLPQPVLVEEPSKEPIKTEVKEEPEEPEASQSAEDIAPSLEPPLLPVPTITLKPAIIPPPDTQPLALDIDLVKKETPERELLPMISDEVTSVKSPLPTVIKEPVVVALATDSSKEILKDSVIKRQEYIPKEEAKEKVPFQEDYIPRDYKPFRFDDLPTKPLDHKLPNNVDFMSGLEKDNKPDKVEANHEDDFSEPETDMKPDSDIVTNILKSDSLTRNLSIDESGPEIAKIEADYRPLCEKDVKPVSVIKEVDPCHKRLSEERDPFALENPCETELKRVTLTLRGEKHSSFLSDVIRADTGFWSAKEVNIDSVIKKVDALCSGEEDTPDEGPWFGAAKNSEVTPVPKLDVMKLEVPKPPEIVQAETPSIDLPKVEEPVKPETPKPAEKSPKEEAPIPEVKQVEEEPPPPSPAKTKSGHVDEPKPEEPLAEEPSTPKQEPSTPKQEPSTPKQEPSTPKQEPKEATADSSMAVEEADVTPQVGQKGRRGVGGRRKGLARGATNVTTRRTRLGQKQTDGSELPSTPRRGRGGKRAGRTLDPSGVNQSKLPADVYEFHDDSDDEGGSGGDKNRPRLILTIKSPVSSTSAPTATVTVATTTVASPTTAATTTTTTTTTVAATMPTVTVSEVHPPSAKPVVEPIEEPAASPAANTRKSRRLQERDGSRNTVDDTIEDVVRGLPILTRSAAANLASIATRRQTRQTNAVQSTLRSGTVAATTEPRKSPRGGKRQAQTRTTSESQDESEGKTKVEEPPPPVKVPEPSKESEKTSESEKPVESTTTSPVCSSPTKQAPASKPATSAPRILQKPRGDGESEEPMSLIDPVTGLLIPMRESEEGQYIPVTSAGGRSILESVDSGLAVADRAKAHDLSLDKTLDEPVSVKPPSPTSLGQVPVISKPQSLAPPVATTPTLPVPPMAVKPLETAMKPAEPISKPVEPITKVPTLKAHVLQQAKNMVQSPLSINVNVVQQMSKPPPNVPTHKSTLSPQPVNLQQPKPQVSPQPVKTAVHPQVVAQPIKNAIVTQAVVQPIKSAVLPQTKVPQPMALTTSPTYPANKIQSMPKGAVVPNAPAKVTLGRTTTPINPKAHLLQSVSKPASPIQQVPQQAHLNKVQLAHPGKVVPATASPPKAHQGVGPPPILTGSVASPPLKASQQPIVTGASSSRTNVPKAQMANLPNAHMSPHGAKGMMIPPKVEVSMGGCIVVPSASPQPRGQVMQAGMPVPAYEASLGDVVQHVFPHSMRPPPHEMPPHYVHPQLMYQQYLRAAHIPYHLTPGGVRSPLMPGIDVKSEPESEEARGSSPPLELRRPASGGARTSAGVPHSLQSPHDRSTDSPQVATVYMHGARLAHYTPRYYDPEPPPAHLRSTRHRALPSTEAPPTQPRLQVATPPHASQVPPQADSLLMLLQRYPVMWQGLLALKNDQAAVQMHFVFGNPNVARDSLPVNADGSTPPLRIAQRMRLEQTQVEGVARKMQMEVEHCMLLALPCGRDHMDVLQQSNNLQTGFITYLQQKQAAGIVNLPGPMSQQQPAYVVHIFPSCDFANENLARIAPDLLHRVADIAHLLIIIATV